MSARTPILLNSCARAATAEEARFRIQGPEPTASAARVVALDAGAADVLDRLAHETWRAAHFLAYRPGTPVARDGDDLPDVELHEVLSGRPVRLSDELDGADTLVMIATGDDGAGAAAAIGEACYRRGVMTGAVVFGDEADAHGAITALRPQAQVLLVTRDEDDVPAVLSALRA